MILPYETSARQPAERSSSPDVTAMTEPRAQRMKVLLISPTAFAPDWAGNSKRVRQIKEMFEEAGFEVYFLFVQTHDANVAQMAAELGGRFHVLPDRKAPKPWRLWHLKSRLGATFRQYTWCNLGVDDWYFDDIGRLAADLVDREQIQVVVCEYIFYSRALLQIKNAVKVIDAHDVFADRYKMFLALGQRPVWYSTTQAGEREALMRSDYVLAIQAADAATFSGYGHRGVHTMEYVPATFSQHKPLVPCSAGPLRLCFLGTANDINYSALTEYLTNIHPALERSGVEFEMVVIGAICDRFKRIGSIHRVEWRGVVKDLEAELSRCDVLINSLASGTGLPIKVLDGLSNCLHVIGSPAGVRGLPLLSKLSAVHVCNDTEAWVRAVTRIANDREAGININSIAAQDYRFILEHVTSSKRGFMHQLMGSISSFADSY